MALLHHVQRISPTGPINGRAGSAGTSETETTMGKKRLRVQWLRQAFSAIPAQCTKRTEGQATKGYSVQQHLMLSLGRLQLCSYVIRMSHRSTQDKNFLTVCGDV